MSVLVSFLYFDKTFTIEAIYGEFIWAYGSRGISVGHGMAARGRHGGRNREQDLHYMKWEENNTHWEWYQALEPQSVTHSFQQGQAS